MKKGTVRFVLSTVLMASLALSLNNCSSSSSSDAPATTTVTSNPTSTATVANTNTTSGGVGVVSVSGKSIAFVPMSLGSGTIGLMPVVVEGASASPALKASGISQASNIATSFGIDSCSVDAVDWKVVCVGYSSSKVAVFDIANYISSLDSTKITLTECDLAPSVSSTYVVPTASFSGGACTNCGIATDPGDHRYIVSSGDGYRVMNYTSCTPASFYNMPINENFGFDAGKNWILAPDYYGYGTFTKIDGTTITQAAKFNVIDVNANAVYAWDKKIDCATLAPTDSSCSWYTTDAASIDSYTHIAALTEESAQATIFVDLDKAVFDSAAKTFTAPHQYVGLTNIASRVPGSSIEPLSHILFMEEEGGNGIAVVQAPATSGTIPQTAPFAYNSTDIPNNTVCSSAYWYNAMDPHGLAIFTSTINNKPYGLLLSDSRDCIALVSLTDLLNAPKLTGTNQVDTVAYNLETNGVIKFVKAPVAAAPALKAVPAKEAQYMRAR